MGRKRISRVLLFLICISFFVSYFTFSPSSLRRVAINVETPANDSSLFSLIPESFACGEGKPKTFLPASARHRETYSPRLVREHPNYPRFLLQGSAVSTFMPDITTIRWTGSVFQESWRQNPKFLLYSAHYEEKEGERTVRVVASWNGETIPPKDSSVCQIWFHREQDPFVFPVSSFEKTIKFNPETINTFIIMCIIPSNLDIRSSLKPLVVSIVDQVCVRPTNLIEISPESLSAPRLGRIQKSEKRDGLKIGVCGKAIYYYNEDFSRRMVEWIEILKLLGVRNMTLHRMETHANITKVLDYYVAEGFLNMIAFRYPPPVPDEPSFKRLLREDQELNTRSVQLMYLSDCFLRTKNHFDYIMVLDPDEIPILRKHKTLPDLITNLKERYGATRALAAIYLLWKYHYPDIGPGPSAAGVPAYIYSLNHNQRNKLNLLDNPTGSGKSIYDTSQVWGITSHHPNKFYDTKIMMNDKHFKVKPKIAYMGHFRYTSCPKLCKLDQMEEENALLRFKEVIVDRISKVYKTLQLI